MTPITVSVTVTVVDGTPRETVRTMVSDAVGARLHQSAPGDAFRYAVLEGVDIPPPVSLVVAPVLGWGAARVIDHAPPAVNG